nr:amino acid permease [Pectinatus sottacetonis]
MKDRHIQLIGLGGAIGVGLFLGSATAIEAAGPAVLLAYAAAGIVIYFIMRAMGEVLIEYPVSGAFSAHAAKFQGPLMGYLTGWSYWFMWIGTGMAEITAIGIYMHHWFPDLPQWLTALGALLFMTAVNFIAVSAYGEFEFWFALIKIVTIVLMIIGCIGIIVFGVGNNGIPTGIANLWTHGGFMPNGIHGVLLAMVMVMYSYLGIEIVGVTAGEAHDPRKTLAAAIDKVFWRILLFYVLSLAVIMCIYPWDQIGDIGSPFVLVFNKLGIGFAADFINFVVITSALSSCNSGLFSTGRMLYNLSLQKKAPAFLAKVNKNHVPKRGILISSCVLLIGVLLNYIAPSRIFIYITSVASFGAMWTWVVILISQLCYRKTLSPEQVIKLHYKMPLSPYTNYLSLLFIAGVVIASALDEKTQIALFIFPVWLIILIVIYYAAGMNKKSA